MKKPKRSRRNTHAQTKAQQKREKKFRELLKLLGYRSYGKALERRCELIDKKIGGELTESESEEYYWLSVLQRDYVKWKTNNERGRALRRAKYLLKQLNERRSACPATQITWTQPHST